MRHLPKSEEDKRDLERPVHPLGVSLGKHLQCRMHAFHCAICLRVVRSSLQPLNSQQLTQFLHQRTKELGALVREDLERNGRPAENVDHSFSNSSRSDRLEWNSLRPASSHTHRCEHEPVSTFGLREGTDKVEGHLFERFGQHGALNHRGLSNRRSAAALATWHDWQNNVTSFAIKGHTNLFFII